MRSAAALESSLGLFTPNRAARLSSLLVSPNPVPLPAFLTQPMKPLKPLKSATPKNNYVMLDEPSILNPEEESPFDCSAGDEMRTPTKDKRKATEDISPTTGRTPKKVSFGPALSPEIFDKSNPPSTPVKRGQQQDPDTPRRHGVSTPSLLSRLHAVGSASKPILTPSRLRTGVLYNVQKPAPLNLLDLADMDEDDSPQPAKTPEKFLPEEPLQSLQDIQTPALEETLEEAEAIMEETNAEDKELGQHAESGEGTVDSSSPDDGRWRKFIAIQSPNADSEALDRLTALMSSDPDLDDTEELDQSPPTTPTRPPRERLASQPAPTPTPTRPRPLLHAMRPNASPLASDDESLFYQNEQPESPSPSIGSNDPTAFDDSNPFMVRLVDENQEPEPEAPSPSRDISSVKNTSEHPVYTPIRRRSAEDIHVSRSAGTPGSASRLALLQLSAQKIRGLPDLLQSPSTLSGAEADFAPSTPTRAKVNLFPFGLALQDDTPEFEGDQVAEFEQPMSGEHEQVMEMPIMTEIGESNEAVTTDDAVNNKDLDATNERVMRTPSPEPSTRHLSIFSARSVPNRRLSAPAGTLMDRSQSPIFSGLRSVFRTPQKVVEFGFASFAGFRNFVRTPTKEPESEASSSRATIETAAPIETREDLVADLEVQTSIEDGVSATAVPEQTEAVQDGQESGGTSPITTPKKQTSHQDALDLLMGGQGPSPKSKEFTFLATQDSLLPSSRSLEHIKARGRRSDIFPQRKAMAIRSQSHSDENRQSGNDMEKGAGVNNRRRTISLMEFKQVASKVLGFTGRQASDATATSDSSDKENEPVHPGMGQQSREDAEQAELLRLLGEGGAEAMEDDDQILEQMEPFGQGQDVADSEDDDSGDQAVYGMPDDAVYVDESKFNALSTPSSRRTSGAGTPSSKRRLSAKHRLGSSSPAFRRYEQQDEDEDENEDDVVDMISPKRARVRPQVTAFNP